MALKTVLFDQSLITKVLSGVRRLVDTVAPTLGPSGRNVILDSLEDSPKITSSGFMIAEKVSLTDPLENMGVQLCREAAAKTNGDVGDGTTTTILFAHSILEGCVRASQASRSEAALVKDILAAVECVIVELTSLSEMFSSDFARAVATTAVQEPETGAFVADCFLEVGSDGLIETQPGNSTVFSRRRIRGMKFDGGYLPGQLPPTPQSDEFDLDDPYILVTTARIDAAGDLVPILGVVAQREKPLLILAADVRGEALQTVIVNATRKKLKCVCVRAPETSDRQLEFLQDLAAITGAELIMSEAGAKLCDTTIEQLGRAKQVRIDPKSTTILEGNGDATRLESTSRRIEARLKSIQHRADYAFLRKRLAGLRGRGIVIAVPGTTEREQKDREAKVKRAILALRSAYEEGVVVGGGSALLRAGDALRSKQLGNRDDYGTGIVIRACESIARQLAMNTGYEGAAIVSRIRESRNLSYGFNVNSKRFEDLISAGVVDPLKVLTTSIRNATSITTQMLAVRTAVIDQWSPAKSDWSKKYGKQSVRSEYRSLSWPSSGKTSDGIKGFAKLIVSESEPIVSGLSYQLDAGIERSSEFGHRFSSDEIEVTIAVSAGNARIKPNDIKVMLWRPNHPSIQETFHLIFSRVGKQAIKVEFYCRRIWLGHIDLDIEIESKEKVEQIR